MSKTKLECCLRSPDSTEVVMCQLCKRRYHYSCISTSKTSFNELNENYKSSWQCPSCARPRSDNTNTPVRSTGACTTPPSDHDTQSSYVSRRKKGAERRAEPPAPSINLSIMDVRAVVREEMQSVLDSFRRDVLDEYQKKTEEILTSMNFLEGQYECIRRDLAEKNDSIKILLSENKALRNTVSDLQDRLSLVEQQSRASNLEIQCIPEHRSENIVSTIKQLANVVKYNLSDTEIQSCTRIRKINKDSPRPRSVLVKFSSPRIRDAFFAAAISFNKHAKSNDDKLNSSHLGIGGKKTPIYVAEHLPPATKALHAEARIKAKELKYEFVWIKNGRVFMRKCKTSECKLIKNSESLVNLS